MQDLHLIRELEYEMFQPERIHKLLTLTLYRNLFKKQRICIFVVGNTAQLHTLFPVARSKPSRLFNLRYIMIYSRCEAF